MARASAAPAVSVIIPCHNAAPTLAATLQSALDQADVAHEVIVVDDGSDDDTLAIANRYRAEARVLTGPNRGVSAARNRGIAESRGEWLVFLDSDDLLAPGTLKARLDLADAAGADVIVCDWQDLEARDGGGAVDGPVRSLAGSGLFSAPEIACATDVWATTAALMYRRTLVDRIGGFRDDLPVIQDARFLFDAAYHHGRFAHSPHLGARYRVLPGSLSRRNPARFWRDVLLNGRQIEALWRARDGLTTAQRSAVGGIYNAAAEGLLRAGDPAFLEAMAALAAGRLPVTWRNRLAYPVASVFGPRVAGAATTAWRTGLRAMARPFRPRPADPAGRP